MAEPRSRWRGLLRTAGLAGLGLVVLLAVFHRPLIFELSRYFIVHIAKQHNLEVDYEMGGSIFTSLRVENFRARPIGAGPVQQIDIGMINLRYSLWGFFRNGPPAILKLVEVREALIELTVEESLHPAKVGEHQAVEFPAFFPEILLLENITFISRGAGGDTEVRGLTLTLLPDGPGVLHIDALEIPGLRRWENISGTTTYRDRNLVLADLAIGPEIAIERLNLDASRLDSKRLGLAIEGAFVGAPVSLALDVTDLNGGNVLDLKLSCGSLDFDAVAEYLALSLPVKGVVDTAVVSFAGAPGEPAGWSGSASLHSGNLAVQDVALGATGLAMELGAGKAVLDAAVQPGNDNRARLHAEAQLPQTLDGFSRTSATGWLEASLSDLSRVFPESYDGSSTGDVHVVADFAMREGALAAKANMRSQKLAVAGMEITDASVVLQMEKELTTPPDRPFFAGLTTEVEGRAGRVDAQGYSAENIRVELGSDNADVTLRDVSFAKGSNTARLSGKHRLPDDLQGFINQPAELSIAIEAPDLSDFVTRGAQASLAGRLSIQGAMSAREGKIAGDLSIDGRSLDVNGLSIRSMQGAVQITDSVARLAPFDVVIDEENHLKLNGRITLEAPHAYEADADVQLRNLSILQPLLGSGEKASKLGGTLIAAWKGSGNAKILQQEGTANVTLLNGRFAEFENIGLHLNVNYSPQFINVSDVRLNAPSVGRMALSAFWADNRMRISNFTVRRDEQMLLEGEADVPLVLDQISDPALAIPNDRPLNISLKSGTLRLRELLAGPGKRTSAYSGTAELGIEASGTLDSLAATVMARGRQLRSAAAGDSPPADVDLTLQLRGNRLGLDGILRQRLIEPLQISGSMPLDLAAWKREGRLDPQTPVQLRLQLPESSLAFAGTLIPAMRQIRGQASADVRVDGTIGQPAIHGTVSAMVDTVRFNDPSLPPVNDVRLRMDFSKNQLRLAQAQARLAGGTVAIAGGVDFADLQKPRLNLRLGARNALVMQNEDLSARASADVRIRGPLDEASVTGTIHFTKSRFFRDIEILPIGLPGRPALVPRSGPTAVGFPNPPLRNWKFDLQIRTQDPFRIQNNLANGRVTADLHLGGTGLNPWLEGNVRIEDLVTSLPFSRLTIQSGFISFSRDQPFEPLLNIRGTSTIRHYDVSVHVHGSANNPQAAFTSNPPLPESDIVSLLATGTTTDELSRDPNVLAGRAAILLARRLSGKLFPRRGPPADDGSFLERFDFDFGAVDPKTGRQSATVRVPLTENFLLLGGLDVTGNVRGRIGYFLRFR